MRLKQPTEKQIENQILSVLKLKGLFVWKNNSTGVFDTQREVFRRNRNPHVINGVADILGCVEGRFVAIEVKSKTGRTTKEQETFQDKINQHGGLAFTTNNLDHCLDTLREYLDLKL